MNAISRPLAAWTILLATILACNLPGGASPTSPPVLDATNAPVNVPEQASSPLPPSETPTPTLTPTITFTPTVTLTPTLTVPMVSVSQNTNCRTGPGTQYNIVGALLIGESAEVVGKNTATNYWIIKNPDSSGTCWLWGNYATVSGNTANLTEYPIPATPTPSIPKPAKDLVVNKICVPIAPPPLFQYSGVLTWTDQSDNEDGFYIYFNGGLFGTTGPNVTTYPLPNIPLPAGTPITMGVESFNVTGKSVMKTIVVVCP